jgi:hypothetical protein
MAYPTQEEIWQQIDSAAYLYLHRLFEPSDNELTITLDEAVANTAKAGSVVLAGGVNLGADSSPIETTSECRRFTLHWPRYITYCVTEEMAGSCGTYEDEVYTGRLLRTYSKSNFLAFIARDTGAHFEPYHHYKIASLNHIIDIAAITAPTLSISSRLEGDTLPSQLIQ